MGHHDQGSSFKSGADSLKEKLFGLTVEGRGRFVEKDHSSRAEKGARDGYSLGLAFAESCSFFAADCVESVRKFVDEFCDCGV